MTTRKATSRTKSAIANENARLRARIRELESGDSDTRSESAKQSRSTRKRDDAEDRVRDIPSHAASTMDKLARGWVYAMVEQMQSGVDAMNAVADEVYAPSRTRDRAKDRERREYRPGDLLSDVASGFAEGVHETLDMPRRAVERFFDAYDDKDDDDDNGSRSSRRGTNTTARSGRARRSTRKLKISPSEGKVETETTESGT